MNRCKTCVMPDTRPDTPFIDGECAACVTYRQRQDIDWGQRHSQLLELLQRHNMRCIVPSSGGKDSTWQVIKLKELGAHVTAVTATTCHLTGVGKFNIENLAKYADETIEITPNRIVRSKLNRLGLELVGDCSWPEHVAIFTIPFKAAILLDNPLLFFGENPQNQYGGPQGTEQARTMTRRWVSEFGGFLGLRPQDMIGQLGITETDMLPYMPPNEELIHTAGIEAHFLGQYLPWDSQRNAEVAQEAGMIWRLPSLANWWPYENLDSAQTGLHDFFCFIKYGYGRLCAQVSVDIRRGAMTREDAMELVKLRDGLFPTEYMGVTNAEVLKQIGMTVDELNAIIQRFTNHELFDRWEGGRPILKEFA